MVVGCGRNHPVASPSPTKMIVVARIAVNRDEKAVAFFDPLRNFMRQACSRRHLHLCAVHIMETASVRKVLLKCKVPPPSELYGLEPASFGCRGVLRTATPY